MKVKAFSWQLILDGLPTRDNLLARNVLSVNGSITCAFCNIHAESSGHLFVHCPWLTSFWSAIFTWLGVDCARPTSIAQLLINFGEGWCRKVVIEGCMMIWHAIMWCIWEIRNAVMFRNEAFDMLCLLDGVKICSWKWFLASNQSHLRSFSDWCVEPLCCLEA